MLSEKVYDVVANVLMYYSTIDNIGNFKKVLMLKKKKSSLIHKIWKFTKLSAINKPEATELKSNLRRLLKVLCEKDLQILLKTLQSNGGIDSECIHIKPTELRHFSRCSNMEPKYLLAQVFRYPELDSNDFLRRLCCCCHFNSCSGVNEECLNPFHSSLVVYSESPLPPYSETISGQSQDDNLIGIQSNVETTCSSSEQTTSSSCSTAKPNSIGTSMTASILPNDPYAWCRILYWELRNRIGRIFDVTQNYVNVFENLPQGDGLCLGLLDTAIHKNKACDKVRKSIGYGFQLTKEPDGVWLYNRSNLVLFASSPTIQTESAGIQQPVVKRLPPGSSALVLDPLFLPDAAAKMKSDGHLFSFIKYEGSEEHSPSMSQLYPYCVRVSFGKGWGLNYTRMSITQCPCWTEIYLNLQN